MSFHLLKPIWKRKSRNLMLSLELLLAFLVVFAVVAIAGRYYQLAQLPIGFRYESVWSVTLQMSDKKFVNSDTTIYDKFERSLEAMPEVEQVAFASFAPYQSAMWVSEFYLPDSDASTDSNMMEVSDDFFAVTGMSIEQGRWFSAADEGAAEQPVVINRQFADVLFRGENAVGKIVSDGKPGSTSRNLLKVTGVFDTFRNKGEFMTPANFVFSRFSPQSSEMGVTTILLKLKPGTQRLFEAKLNQQLKLVRNDWGYQISPLSDLRRSLLHEMMTPLIVLAVIAAFLLTMVAFGLFGVLWQNTTQRIPEIGLRRAIGANAGNIYRQIVTEQLLLSTLAMLVGLLLLVQLPITGVFGENLNWTVFLGASAVSMAMLYLLSTLCALYPAWQASRLSPTEALHYE